MTPTTPAPITSGDALKKLIGEHFAVDLDDLEKKARAAMPGPWTVGETFYDGSDPPETVIRGLEGEAAVAVALDFGANNPTWREANAALIAATSPPVILSLIYALRSKIAATRATDAPAQGEATPLADLWIHEDMDRDAMASALNAPRKDLKAAHQQAVEDLLHWRRRAMEAEAKLAAQGEQVQVPSGEIPTWQERLEKEKFDDAYGTITCMSAEIADLRAAIAQRAGAADKPTVDDLAMLVRQLVRALSKAKPDSDLPARALGYLKRKGLQGSPLRAATADAAPAGAVGCKCGRDINWCISHNCDAPYPAAAEVTPAPQCNLSASSLEAQGCKEVRAVDALDGMGFTYDEEIGWLPPAPATAAASVPDGWISVEDERKPKGRTPILVTVDYVRYGEYEDGTPGEWRSQIVTEGEYVPQHSEAGDYFTSYSSPHGDADVVTHWMPLPAAAQSAESGREG